MDKTIAIVFLIIALIPIWMWTELDHEEMKRIRCDTYNVERVFDECVKNKSCAIRHGRQAEWREYKAWQSMTYDCPRQ